MTDIVKTVISPPSTGMDEQGSGSYISRNDILDANMENLRLWANKQITDEEYSRIDEMIRSNDRSNLTVAQESMKSLSKLREKGYYQGVNIMARLISEIINSDQQTDEEKIRRIKEYLRDMRVYTS